MDIQSLIEHMSRCGAAHDQVVIALSGGVDSGLVAYAAHHALGLKCVGVTIHSELTPIRDVTRAAAVAESIGLAHHPVPLRMMGNKHLCRNTEDRCYHCKKQIFQMMISEYGDNCLILDGTTADDDPARPGLQAVREFGVNSPLAEMGMGKDSVRFLARSVGLFNCDTPSESCLATRISQGIPLTSEALERVQAMESFFHELGIETLRAFHDNLVATIQCKPQYTEIIMENRDKFAALIEKIGLRSYILKEWTG